jgi:hypothetical protein
MSRQFHYSDSAIKATQEREEEEEEVEGAEEQGEGKEAKEKDSTGIIKLTTKTTTTIQRYASLSKFFYANDEFKTYFQNKRAPLNDGAHARGVFFFVDQMNPVPHSCSRNI